MWKFLVIAAFLIGTGIAQEQISLNCQYIEEFQVHRMTRVEKSREDEVLARIQNELRISVLRKNQIICMAYKDISPLRNESGKHYMIQYANDQREGCILGFDDLFANKKLEFTLDYCNTHEGVVKTLLDVRVDPQCGFFTEIVEGLFFVVKKDDEEKVFERIAKELKITNIKSDQVICILWAGVVNAPEFPGRNYLVRYMNSNGQLCLITFDTYIPPCYINQVLDYCPNTSLVYHKCDELGTKGTTTVGP